MKILGYDGRTDDETAKIFHDAGNGMVTVNNWGSFSTITRDQAVTELEDVIAREKYYQAHGDPLATSRIEACKRTIKNIEALP